jgi:hypothetical protein
MEDDHDLPPPLRCLAVRADNSQDGDLPTASSRVAFSQIGFNVVGAGVANGSSSMSDNG